MGGLACNKGAQAVVTADMLAWRVLKNRGTSRDGDDATRLNIEMCKRLQYHGTYGMLGWNREMR
jgi:hypothetical protein